jgi:hypothetical protein
VASVDQSQRLDHPCLAVFRIALVGVETVHVDAGDIRARIAGGEPLGHDSAEATAGDDADGVEPRGDEVVLDLRRLAEGHAHVGGEALRATEELPEADLL